MAHAGSVSDRFGNYPVATTDQEQCTYIPQKSKTETIIIIPLVYIIISIYIKENAVTFSFTHPRCQNPIRSHT